MQVELVCAEQYHVRTGRAFLNDGSGSRRIGDSGTIHSFVTALLSLARTNAIFHFLYGVCELVSRLLWNAIITAGHCPRGDGWIELFTAHGLGRTVLVDILAMLGGASCPL